MTTTDQLLTLTPAALNIVARIEAHGRALIVGGSVRDALLARRGGTAVSKDIDIEAHGYSSYQQLAAALEGVGFVDFRGQAFGVLAVNVGGEDFDISLPRMETVAGAGHRGFVVTHDPELDERAAFARRDFTINAIGWRPATGEVIDYFGGGADLRAGLLRTIGPAFSEDPLRVLRAVQFAGRFGFTPTSETVAASRSIAHRFVELSTERVFGEFRKLARRGQHVGHAVGVLDQLGWLQHFPALADLAGVEQDPVWHPEGDVLTHSKLAADQAVRIANEEQLDDDARELLVFSALLHDVGKAVTTMRSEDGRWIAHGHDAVGGSIARRFLLDIGAPHDLAGNVRTLVREHMAHTNTGAAPSATTVRRLIRRLGDDVSIYDWARLVEADLTGRGIANRESPAPAWLAIAEHTGPTPRPSLLRGQHLAELGYAPGPGWGVLIAAAVEAQDDGEFDDEAGAVRWVVEHGFAPVGTPAPPSNAQRRAIAKWRRDRRPALDESVSESPATL